MKKRIEQKLEVPEGISCRYENKFLICNSNSTEIKKKLSSPGINIKLEGKEIIFVCDKGNRKDSNKISTFCALLKNIFKGLKENYTYKLESASVHFPMNIKVDGDKVTITNFLGEKTPRYAKIVPNSKVDIKSNSITVTSHDKESAGQTAANLEKATKVGNSRDRRIFQDGIYIIEKPLRSSHPDARTKKESEIVKPGRGPK